MQQLPDQSVMTFPVQVEKEKSVIQMVKRKRPSEQVEKKRALG